MRSWRLCGEGRGLYWPPAVPRFLFITGSNTSLFIFCLSSAILLQPGVIQCYCNWFCFCLLWFGLFSQLLLQGLVILPLMLWAAQWPQSQRCTALFTRMRRTSDKSDSISFSLPSFHGVKHKELKGPLLWHQMSCTQRSSAALPKCFWVSVFCWHSLCPSQCSVAGRNWGLLFPTSAGNKIPPLDHGSWLSVSVWPMFPVKKGQCLRFHELLFRVGGWSSIHRH